MPSSMALPPLHAHSDDSRQSCTLAEFASAFPLESTLVERKTGVRKEPLQEARVAFSNTHGGLILIGVRDDGEVLGWRLSTGLEQEVLDAVADAVHPTWTATALLARHCPASSNARARCTSRCRAARDFARPCKISRWPSVNDKEYELQFGSLQWA